MLLLQEEMAVNIITLIDILIVLQRLKYFYISLLQTNFTIYWDWIARQIFITKGYIVHNNWLANFLF